MGGKQGAIKDVPRPQSLRFIRPNETESFPSKTQVLGEMSDPLDSVTAKSLGLGWLDLDAGMFHVKLCAANYRVAIGALALGVRGKATL